jgi:hypothetical protein
MKMGSGKLGSSVKFAFYVSCNGHYLSASTQIQDVALVHELCGWPFQRLVLPANFSSWKQGEHGLYNCERGKKQSSLRVICHTLLPTTTTAKCCSLMQAGSVKNWRERKVTCHQTTEQFNSFIHQWLYSPLLGPAPFFSFVILLTQTVGLLGRGSARRTAATCT